MTTDERFTPSPHEPAAGWWGPSGAPPPPPPPPPLPVPPGRPSGRRLRRVAGLGALAGVVGLGAYGVAAAVTGPAGAPATVAAADASGTASGTASGGPTTAVVPGPAGGVLAGPGGQGLGVGPGGGTLSAIDPGSITVTRPDGSTQQFTTDSSTTYTKDGQAASRSDLAVGEHVDVRPAVQVPPSSGSGASTTPTVPVATSVNIESPAVVGTVVSVGNGTITVEDAQGFWRTVYTSGATTYDRGGQSAVASDVTRGVQIVARGTIASNHTDLDATTVSIVLPQVGGQVTSVAAGTIVLSTPGGSVTVHTTPSTAYRTRSGSGSASDVAQGDHVLVEGDKAADGSYAATTVTVLPAGPAGPGGHWGPGPMGGASVFGGPPVAGPGVSANPSTGGSSA